MNYESHNLRSNLQEWRSRLYRTTFQQLGNQLKFFANYIENTSQLKGIIYESIFNSKYNNDEIARIYDSLLHGQRHLFDDEADQAAFSYLFLNYCLQKAGNYNLRSLNLFMGGDFEEFRGNFIETYISPILIYFHNTLDASNSVLFLLEKYKKRVEWFYHAELLNKYLNAERSFEKLLEDDLRLFLFDQGIDYPFSTPKSASGRADIVGEIDTDDPIVIEIKIFDKEKRYDKNRIKEGFNQIVKYTNDYNKNVGYLVIFNMNQVEINFKFDSNSKMFPPAIHFNNKIFYFIVINCNNTLSASKLGSIEQVEVTEAEIINN